MNAYQRGIVAMGCIGVMLGAAGCANKEIVKKDEPVVGNATVAKPVAALPSTTKASSEKKPAIATPAAVATPSYQQPANSTVSQTALEKIYFDFDSSDLIKSARESLARNAEILLKERNAKLSIEGNCDERGSAEYNLALGERRAKAAAKYLITLGVKPERLTTISYGKEKPAVQGNDEAAWSKNRRDEFVIQK